MCRTAWITFLPLHDMYRLMVQSAVVRLGATHDNASCPSPGVTLRLLGGPGIVLGLPVVCAHSNVCPVHVVVGPDANVIDQCR